MISVAKMQTIASIKMASVGQDVSHRYAHWPNGQDRDAFVVWVPT
jgi:hypothetical protein